ncbi:Fanconi anemia group B protein [Xyrauchen texanus]|uniref:Fanconi anemia group B protein n=1 Tax=Xyrauchen texanus TaxID=154827 RepID=UPI002241B7DE|nr:Fanconi anemia group B protein [Xyrauchen texanus]XP_052004438.1 Fanconi anemia group B protein [Xyrauchen texanus]
MAAERCIKMLPVRGDVLVFQCSKTRDHRRGSEVSFCRLSFDRNSRKFSVKDPSMNPMHKDSLAETDIVHCCSAVDVQQMQKVPCVLLRLCKKRTSGFKYMLYSISSPTDGKLHVEFVLLYEMRDNIAILQGPTLAWCHENTVFYASSQTGGVKELPIPLTAIFIGELPLRKRSPVVLGTQSATGLSEQFSATEASNILYFMEDGRTFNGACLVQNAYSSVIRCVNVLSVQEHNGSLRSSVLAATSMKQLVYFENGLPRDVCPLPCEQPLKIEMLHTPRNDSLIVITFNGGNICSVWKNTFQVACCWSGVHLLLIDDFLGCGSDQILLVFEEQCSSGELLSNFLLTDLCGITYSCGRDGEVLNTSDTAQENHLLTVQALESRLQSGLNVLEELQGDVYVKDRVLQQSLLALTDLISGRTHVISAPEQEGLVSLWDDDDDDDGAVDVWDDQMHTECAEARVKVDRVWQRVIGQSLVFGAVLTTTTTNNMSVENISGSIVAEHSGSAPVAVNSRSKTLQYRTSDMTLSHDPFAAKKIRQADCPDDEIMPTLALLTVTDLTPILTSGSGKCSLMLHYGGKSLGPSSEACGRVSQHCGKISLDIKDVSLGKFQPRLLKDSKLNTEEAREDLLSLMAVYDVWWFLIESSDHTLTDVQRWLQEFLHAERLEVEPQYSACLSTAMLFHWQQNTPFQGVLTVHCRDELQLLQFLHSLGDFLPVSHHIQLLKTPRARRDALALTQTLESEIQTVTQEVSSVLQCDEDIKREETSAASSEQLQRLRDEWQSERDRYNKRLRPLVDATRYSTLVERLIHTQLRGDEVALMEAQATEVQGIVHP